MTSDLARAARILDRATALVVAAGAGMGVDSGLPDFRGEEGFWRAYPPLRALGIRFEAMADPRWFERDPALAWGFYGHRLALYRLTVPHEGFSLLKRWGDGLSSGSFVFTSNVDGQFQRAGFSSSRIHECHGSLLHLQCTRCDAPVWPADELAVEVDKETLRATSALPACPSCGAMARPNVLMFGDASWQATRSDAQATALQTWWRSLPRDATVAVVECGAGTAVPSVRRFTEGLTRAGATLIRINVREPDVGPGDHVGLATPALAALSAIARLRAET